MREKEGESSGIRPVVMEFGSEQGKWKVLERDDEFARVFLEVDMSKEEQEVTKNKRVERKKQKEREREEGGKSGEIYGSGYEWEIFEQDLGGALVWNENVRKNVERMQNEYGRYMWRLERTVRNAAVHGESGWSLFWERQVKAKVAFVRLREEWMRRWREERGDEDLVEGVLGFAVTSADLERLVLRSVGKIWKEQKRLYILEIEDVNKEKLERQIVTMPKQRHFNPINLNQRLAFLTRHRMLALSHFIRLSEWLYFHVYL
ncbi:hypothetical protein CAPTEDRAFT_192582 [Capitella teleta]|uniref:Uncharacterized protein n=1 Tax=Capitella teleta TaxID=283909 RepID=R7V2K1_CAPTE|nr:hypothetical protein CAPTEDRAFT_192582 [Capitella teleta]|eukprot:ELU12759.1 hypothetical protein CAPTEDRAFT_192582 [Capitella teleta]